MNRFLVIVLSLLAVLYTWMPTVSAASENENVLIIHQVLKPNSKQKHRKTKKLRPEAVDAAMFTEGLNLVAAKQGPLRENDVRWRVIYFLQKNSYDLVFNDAQKKQINSDLSSLLAANPKENVILEMKSRLSEWRPEELPILYRSIVAGGMGGVSEIGASILFIANRMTVEQKADLRSALLKRLEHAAPRGEYEVLVLTGLATQTELVKEIRNSGKSYQAFSGQCFELCRFFFPVTSFLPAPMNDEEWPKTRPDLEKYIAAWNFRPARELAEKFLLYLNQGYRSGDPTIVEAVELAKKLGPKDLSEADRQFSKLMRSAMTPDEIAEAEMTEMREAEAYTEFFDRVRTNGFTLDGKPPETESLEAHGVTIYHFVGRSCGDLLN
jgi:hypothetical protein